MHNFLIIVRHTVKKNNNWIIYHSKQEKIINNSNGFQFSGGLSYALKTHSLNFSRKTANFLLRRWWVNSRHPSIINAGNRYRYQMLGGIILPSDGGGPRPREGAGRQMVLDGWVILA